MPKNLSKFESEVYLLYLAKTPTSTITTILKKNIKAIYNAIKRKKKVLRPLLVE